MENNNENNSEIISNPEIRFSVSEDNLQWGINGAQKSNDEIMEELKKKKNEMQRVSLDKYMIIGSVVGIEGNYDKLMIIGYNPTNNNGSINDYLACVYPNGATGKLITFNHEDIKKVYFVGFTTEYGNEFKSQLVDNNGEKERNL